MARMIVSLEDIHCRDTEDVSGGDTFYLTGVVTDGYATAGIATRPVWINDDNKKGMTKRFGEGGGVVFDAVIPDNHILKVAFAAFDEDAAKDWAKRGQAVTMIAGAVGQALKQVPNPAAVAAGAILPIAVAAVGGLMSLDGDDHLGNDAREFPVWAIPPGEHWQLCQIAGRKRGRFGGWWSSWQYTVRYRVIKHA